MPRPGRPGCPVSRRQDVAAIAEPGGGQRGHPAELAAADEADGGVRRQRERHAERVARRARPPTSVCSCAPMRRAARPAPDRPMARIAAASRAALTAPARPIASVPTGTPAGICTIESRLSMPLEAMASRPARRAPASGVQAAHMPGRCAAPPAPAMMTFSPRSRAVCGILAQAIRRAVGRDDPRLVRRSPAARAFPRRGAGSASPTGCP